MQSFRSLRVSLAVGTLLAAPLASAVTFTVNNTLDKPDASPGDGVCSYSLTLDPKHNAVCTLRAAVMEGNATILQESVEVLLSPGAVYKLTIGGSAENGAQQGDLDAHRKMRVGVPHGSAEKAQIDANKIDRAFYFFDEAAGSELYGVEVKNGHQESGYGAAIYTEANMTLDFVDVHHATSGNGTGFRSAIQGPVAIRNSRIHHNGTAARSVAGVHTGPEALTVIVQSTIDHNFGDGVNIQGLATGPTLLLYSATVSNNTGTGVNLRNANASIVSSTIADNSLDPGHAQLSFSSPNGEGFKLILRGSIVKGADGDTCYTANNVSASEFFAEWNLYSDDSCISDTLEDHSQHEATIELSELADWGGKTPTRLPLLGSAVIDFAPPDVCSATGLDQRELPRPVASDNAPMPLCDVGAVELQKDDVAPEPPIFEDGFEG